MISWCLLIFVLVKYLLAISIRNLFASHRNRYTSNSYYIKFVIKFYYY